MDPTDAAVTRDTQQKLKLWLEKNRFKNVVVIPEADVIRAQAPDGSKIIIEIIPDHLTGVVSSGSTADQTPMRPSRPGDALSSGAECRCESPLARCARPTSIPARLVPPQTPSY